MHNRKIELEIDHWQILEDVPSASGVVKWRDDFYAIGDDSPYLFQLDSEFKVVSKRLIYSAEKLEGSTLPKFYKPDFEAMEMISSNEIFVFGSGSKSPERDVCVLVELGTEMKHTEYDISLFYYYLRNLEIMQGFELDIEALGMHGEVLYLFNRGRNLIFSFSLTDFLSYCKTGTDFPIPKVNLFSLPKIQGLEAGFSGATTFGNSIVFTAAVEDAPNAYEDGEILGSFLGLIEIKSGEVSDEIRIDALPDLGFPLKVESVAVSRVISESEIEVVLVTDNDGEPSEVIQMRIRF